MTQPCPHCRTTIKHGNRFGCCSGCHRMFAGQSAFDRHQQVGDNAMICRDPETITNKAGRFIYEVTRHQGFVVWRLASTGGNPWATDEVAS